MPRNSSGTYSLPQLPFVPNTVISSGAVNSNYSDIALALTQSLATNGVTTMTGQFLAAPGTFTAPSISFGDSVTTGLYTGALNQFNMTAGGLLVATVSSAGIQVNSGSFLDTNGARISVPVGTVVDYAGSAAPSGWLFCYGQAVSRTAYSFLFQALGTIWGVGDGSTTFNVPDLRGRAIYGKDNMGGTAAGRITAAGGNYDGTVLGTAGGAENHTLTVAELPVHTPSGTVHGTIGGSQTVTGIWSSNATTTALTATTFDTPVNENQTITVNGSNFTFTGSFTGNNIGSGNAHTVLNPSAICNKIIFTGV